MTAITIAQLTEASVDGVGIYDVLMKSTKAHLEQEFSKNRITGPNYATVYLGALEGVLNTSLQFLLQQQAVDLQAELLKKQIQLTEQQYQNAILEGKVLVAEECKLRAEFDLTVANVVKAGSENALLVQKVATEKAQVQALGVDDDSVIGKQKALYQAQTDGFQRDSEQKLAKTMIDTWNSRRLTDDGTSANTVNKLDDAQIGRAVDKMFTGVGA